MNLACKIETASAKHITGTSSSSALYSVTSSKGKLYATAQKKSLTCMKPGNQKRRKMSFYWNKTREKRSWRSCPHCAPLQHSIAELTPPTVAKQPQSHAPGAHYPSQPGRAQRKPPKAGKVTGHKMALNLSRINLD